MLLILICAVIARAVKRNQMQSHLGAHSVPVVVPGWSDDDGRRHFASEA